MSLGRKSITKYTSLIESCVPRETQAAVRIYAARATILSQSVISVK